MVQKETYLHIFNRFLEPDILPVGLILEDRGLTPEDKQSLLEELSLRLQTEFGKEVYLVSSDNFETELPRIKKESSFYPLITKKDKVVFLLDIRTPYFKNDPSWEERVVDLLTYYKFIYFGFSARSSVTNFYI